MSVDSGLPDYRGTEGFWNHYPAYRDLHVDYAAMTRPSGFARDSHFAWGFYGHCLSLYRSVQPHGGYCALKQILERSGISYFILSTNVDGLFMKAGFPQDRVRECHGSVHRLQCIHPCQRTTWSAEGTSVTVNQNTMRAQDPLPRCPHCGGLARPAVFAFGDSQYVWEDTQAQAERYQAWKSEIRDQRLVVLECGSGSTVPGLRREGLELARSHGGHLIRVNLRESHVDHPDDVGLTMPAVEALQQISSLA